MACARHVTADLVSKTEREIVTVDELREIIKELPGDMEIILEESDTLPHDESPPQEISISVEIFAPLQCPDSTPKILRRIWQYSGHPKGTTGKPYLCIG